MAFVYYGFRNADGPVVRYLDEDRPKTHWRELLGRQDLVHHADAFAWGYTFVPNTGTKMLPRGASQLALALCAHALKDDERAIRLHQRFKKRVMEEWPENGNLPWRIEVDEICAACDALDEVEKETARGRRAAVSERVVPLSETGGQDFGKGPAKWRTDENGKRLTERGED